MTRGEVDWSGYVAFQPGVRGPWHELPRRDAQAVFERLMAAREERVHKLRELLRRNDVALSGSNEGVAQLEEWFCRHIEPDDPDEPERPAPIWLAVAFDIGVFLGELICQRRPSAHWVLHTGAKRELSYQRPILVGFGYEDMQCDPILLVSQLAFRALASRECDEKFFLKMLWSLKATEDWSPRQQFLTEGQHHHT